MKKVLIIDTSILCCWLEVPGKSTAGPVNDQWNYSRIDELLEQEKAANSTLVLPIATLIETGNHIAQASSQRYECAQELAGILLDAANGTSPWASFSEQSHLWDENKLHQLANDWPDLANGELSFGDATIKDVAEYYAKAGCYSVEILTADEGLKAYQPVQSSILPEPRRRS